MFLLFERRSAHYTTVLKKVKEVAVLPQLEMLAAAASSVKKNVYCYHRTVDEPRESNGICRNTGQPALLRVLEMFRNVSARETNFRHP